MFVKDVKQKFLEAKSLGDIPKWMKQWVVKKADWMRAYGLKRAFNNHLKEGHGMTLEESNRCLRWCMSLFDSEKARFRFLLEVNTVMFYHTRECEELNSYPFSRPLDELLEDIIQERVDAAVTEALRTQEWKRKQEEIGK